MIKLLFKKAIRKKVFTGKYFLKFEKNPFYSRRGDKLVGNYKLGFTNMALRCKYTQADASKLTELSQLPGYPSVESLSTHYISIQQEFWKFYLNSMIRIDHTLAVLVDNIQLEHKDRKVLGYYGYSHRGGQTFKIGDRFFEERYEPKEEDYPEWQWAGWKEEFSKSWDEGDDFDRKMIYNEGIVSIIPFRFRGPKNIETLEEAKQAAINVSNYLS